MVTAGLLVRRRARKIVWEGVDRWELDGERAVRGIRFFDTTAIRQALADRGS
jgi:hypothetical protein